MRLRMGRRVAADHRAGARRREPMRRAAASVKRVALLVTMPHFSARAFDRIEQRGDAGEEHRCPRKRSRVVSEKRVAQRRIVGIVGVHAHAGAEQSARAVRGDRRASCASGNGAQSAVARARGSARRRDRARYRRACRRDRTAPRRRRSAAALSRRALRRWSSGARISHGRRGGRPSCN